MKYLYSLAIVLLLLVCPIFEHAGSCMASTSEFETVLQSDSNTKWNVKTNQILDQWSPNGNRQQSSKLTIKGYPEYSYSPIYIKPKQSLVIEYVEESGKYQDKFQMSGIIVNEPKPNTTPLKQQSLTVDNIKFANFINAISNKGGKVTLSNTEFIKNKSNTDGAGVLNLSGSLTIKNTTFTYNLTKSGRGGAIYNNGKLTAKNSCIGSQHNEGIYHLMTYNSVTDESPEYDVLSTKNPQYKLNGLLGNDDWITIYYLVPEWSDLGHIDSYWVHVYPLGNYATNGGGVFNDTDGTAVIRSTTVKHNRAVADENIELSGYGGGIYNQGKLTVKKSVFSGNYATYGGGVYTKSELDTTILSTDFSGNYATLGGGMYIDSGNIVFKNNTFSGNYATNGGGVYSSKNELKINNSNFYNNHAEKGGDIYNVGKMTISKSNFTSNNSLGFVQIIPRYVYNGDMILEGSIYSIEQYIPISSYEFVVINYGSSANYGGSIYNTNKLEVLSSKFKGAYAVEGGAVYNDDSAELSIQKTDFNSNYAQSDSENALGGAIYNKGDLEIIKSKFSSNYAESGSGGAIYNSSKSNIYNSTFSDNRAYSGGAIYNKSGMMKLETDNFDGNYAELGGAIYNESELTVESSKFTNNSAYTYGVDDYNEKTVIYTSGGVIYNSDNAQLKIVDSLFGNKSKKFKTTNTAKYGASIYNSGTATVTTSDIYYQTSEYGAFFNEGTLTSDRVNYINNKSTSGGAIYNYVAKTLDIKGSTFKSNSAENGGAVVSDGVISIGDSTYDYTKNKKTLTKTAQTQFISNTATKTGGAIYISNYGSGKIENVEFQSNKVYSETTDTKTEQAKTETVDGVPVFTEAKTIVTTTPQGEGGAIYFGAKLDIGKTSEGSASSETFKIVNSNFKSNSAGAKGGAISVQKGFNISIENTTFESNSALTSVIVKTTTGTGKNAKTTTTSTYQGDGGALYLSGDSTITITNSEFTKNGAVNGGAVCISAFTGSQTDENYNINITDTTFTKNEGFYGGAILNTGKLKLDKTSFNSNFGIMAGAVYNVGKLLITECGFEHNYANAGGAFYNVGTLNIENCTFLSSNNTTAAQGGFGYNYAGTLTIKNSTFTSGRAQMGGVLLNTYYVTEDKQTIAGKVTSDTNTYKNCMASSGGVIYNASEFTSTNDKYLENASSYGGAILNAGVMTIEKAEFDKNVSYGQGGAIFTNNNLTLKDSTITNGTAYMGGAIISVGESKTDEESKITYGSTLNISDTTIKDNTALIHGGAIYFTGSQANITKTTFEHNKSNMVGGAIVITDDAEKKGKNKIIITDSDFKSNTAVENGGAIFIGGEAEIKDIDEKDDMLYLNKNDTETATAHEQMVFEKNEAKNGGAIYNIATVYGDNIYFENNKATGMGGAICNWFITKLGDTDSQTYEWDIDKQLNQFRSNSAKYGGAIYNGENGRLSINGAQFRSNSATSNGGAICNLHRTFIANALFGSLLTDEETKSNINKLYEYGNIADVNGGAIYSSKGSSLEVYVSKFSANTSKQNGGAIYFDSNTNFKSDSVEFYYNKSLANGGGVYVNNDSTVNTENMYFKSNTADKNGGGMYVGNYSTVNITNSGFEQNTALNGGAVYVGSYSTVTLKDVNFENNSATINGGAIYIEDKGKAELISETRDVVFQGNKANGKSNAIYMNGTSKTKQNTLLTLATTGNYSITINDDISGTGTIKLNGDVKLGKDLVITPGSDISIDSSNGSITLANDSGLNSASLKLSSMKVSLNMSNGQIGNMKLNTITLADNQTSNVVLDADLKSGEVDKITAQKVEGTGVLNVSALKLTSDNKSKVNLKLGEDSLVTTMSVKQAESLQATYKLKSSLDENGHLRATAYGQKAKPTVLAAPVAAQIGGYLTQVNSYDQAFTNLDMEMILTREERQAQDSMNKYAMSEGYFNGFDNGINRDSKGLWNRAYATFERVNLSHGPKVGNIGYGDFFGGDMGKKELSNGWKRQFSAYIGYNGSTQDFDRQSIDQNGGTLGIMETWYKGNFFTALTANVSGNFADASTDIGKERMAMLMAGIASKTGYNFEFCKGKFILQPSLLLSYSFVHTFSHRNGLGNKVGSSPLHGIQVAPGVKFIFNLPKGWQPYMGINMRWNIVDKTHFSLQDVNIPDMSINPYVEYGIGLQRRWGERFTGYGQAMVRNGGRNGVMLSFGFRWLIGK